MEWKQYAFAGAPPTPRWAHSATVHGSKIVLYGGRDDHNYHNSHDVFDFGMKSKPMTIGHFYQRKI
jgi:hypothetical protein